MSFKKNTAVTGFTFGMVSSTDGSDINTGTPVGYYTLDGGTQTAIADVTPTFKGNGQWSFDLLATEMNGDIVALTFTHPSAITVHFTIKTELKLTSDLNDLSATDPIATVTTVTNQATDYATSASIAALNDIAATEIVSAGAITTLSGAIVNVDIVDTVNVTTTNSDMRGTDGAATSANLAIAQADLNTITGADGVTLATAQALYAPNKIAPDNASIANILVDTSDIQPRTLAIELDTNELQTNQGNWLTATGFSTSGALASVDGNVNSILTDTGITIPATIATLQADTDDIQAKIGVPSATLSSDLSAVKTVVDDVPTTAEFQARTPTAAQLSYIIENASVGVPVTFTSGTVTTAILASVNGIAPSATTDQYKGRLLVFTNSSLEHLVTDITGYNGATKEVTVTATTLAISGAHTARLI